jgi:hypothetical protein
MAQNIGTLISASIRPNDSNDPIASAYAVEIKGGLHTAATLSDRDNIILQRREWGMLCYVIDEKKTYKLEYNFSNTDLMNNSNWIEFQTGGSGSDYWLDTVLMVRADEPISPNDGDRYLACLNSNSFLTGPNWSSLQGGLVLEWNDASNEWLQTIPLDASTVRVIGTSSCLLNNNYTIYRYEGVYPSGSWVLDLDVENGLSISSDKNIILGGTLSQNTVIDGVGSYSFVLDDVDQFSVVMNSGLLILDSNSTFDIYGGDIGLYSTGSIDLISTLDIDIQTLDFNLNFTGFGTVSIGSSQSGLVYSATPSNLQDLSLVTKQYVDSNVEQTTQVIGLDIDFSSKKVFNTAANPGTGSITATYSGVKLGIIQKIYHLQAVGSPTFPASWVLIGDGIYMSNQLNIIYCEWAGDNRVEYWITQEQF